MANISVIKADNTAQWMEVLDRVELYDFYHLPSYHLMHKKREDEHAILFVYEEDDMIVALPLLVSPLRGVLGVPEECEWYDASSVYGYSGPLLNRCARDVDEFISRFQQELIKFAQDMGIISLFSRLHPLLGNHRWLQGVGSLIPLGLTVSIDLNISLENQLANYRKGLRYDIRRARRAGVQAYRDTSWIYYEDFINLYSRTMSRLGAKQNYYFDRAYFDGLRDILGDGLSLFVAEIEGKICSAALFVHTCDIIQYHLSGSLEDYQAFAPSKVILDEVRLWGNTIGALSLHLGGGVGADQDNLFRFKAGFSPLQHQFYVWNMVAIPTAYNKLMSARNLWLEENGKERSGEGFFPEYRADIL